MTSAQVVETSVTNNSSFQNYPHPDDHTIQTTDTPGFKPFTNEYWCIKTPIIISWNVERLVLELGYIENTWSVFGEEF